MSQPVVLTRAKADHECREGRNGFWFFLAEVSGEPLVADIMLKDRLSVSKPADLGYGVPICASKANGNRRQGTRCFTQVQALSMEVKPYFLLD